jgi:deferrochelatase/peroxidase EfeB
MARQAWSIAPSVYGIGQPAIEGSGVDPLPGQGEPIKAGEFILGYAGEAGMPLPMPEPDVLGRNGAYVGLRKYQTRVGAFNRFLRANGETEEERELLAAKVVGRWRSGAPLTLRRQSTTRRSARTRSGTTTSPTPMTRRASRRRSAATCGG